MQRNARKAARTMTPKQREVAERVAAGLSPTAAAAAAGYSDPHGEVDRLMNNPLVRDYILRKLQREVVSWRVLLGNSKKMLSESVRIGLEEATKAEPDPSLLKLGKDAAVDVVANLRKINPGELSEKASAEDQAEESVESIAQRILDGDTDPLPPSEEV